MSTPFPSRPSMQDVARVAGVHQTTVSRALRNDHRLPAATCRRIQRVAEKMGYRPHPFISALIVQRRARHPPRAHATIAYVMRAEFQLGLPLDYLAGVRAAAEQQGYTVDVFSLGPAGRSEQRLNRVLLTRNIHGLIVAPLPEAGGSFVLDWARFCTVVIEYTFADPAFDRVVHDNYGGMRRIMQECRRRGLGRVGLVLTTGAHERTEHAHAAAYWCEQKSGAGFAALPPLVLPEWREAAFHAWWRRHQPEVIVTSRVLEAEVMAWCAARRLRLGRDLQFVNLNTTRAGQVAGIFQNPVAIGSIAARLVIDKITHNDRGPPAMRQTVLTSGLWVDGPTLRPVPAPLADTHLLNARNSTA